MHDRPGLSVSSQGARSLGAMERTLTTAPRVRALAFYLPQFHPVPENDNWWGTGFTEWRNVARAKRLYPGHHQPHLPGELGFYDLRLPETRSAQAQLAYDHGIAGFVYYHYWFSGRRILERPFNEVLASGEPDFPFCLAWANENWTRIWDGGPRDVLLRQSYSDADDLEHIRSLLPAFADDRYIRWQGRPVFLVYRSSSLPDSRRTTDLWRQEVIRAGLPEPYLLRVESSPEDEGAPLALGFDAAVEFQPRAWDLPPRTLALRVGARTTGRRGIFSHMVREYGRVADWAMSREGPTYTRWPGVTPMWDNTARKRRDGLVLRDSSPEAYGRWLANAVEQARAMAVRNSADEGLVFVNAWNEWAEGNHLEPDRKHGRAYLDVTRAVMEAS